MVIKVTGFCHRIGTFCVLKTTIFREKKRDRFFCGATYNSLKENIKVP